MYIVYEKKMSRVFVYKFFGNENKYTRSNYVKQMFSGAIHDESKTL